MGVSSDFKTPAEIDSPFVIVKQCGEFSEVIHLSKLNDNTEPPKRFDSNNFVNADGELIPIKNHSENRSENVKSLANTFRNLRDLINCNCLPSSSLWVTLTYAENMTCTGQLAYDFDIFMKRLKRRYDLKYIAVAEPQSRGAWHWHLILMFPYPDPFIPNDVMSELWGHGFTKTVKLCDIDNIGAYLTAYLTDAEQKDIPDSVLSAMPDPEIKEVKTEGGTKKKFIKGGRLWLYPRDFKLFRSSRGLVRPDKTIYKVVSKSVSPESLYAEPVSFGDVLEILKSLGDPTYQLSKNISFDPKQKDLTVFKTFYRKEIDR